MVPGKSCPKEVISMKVLSFSLKNPRKNASRKILLLGEIQG
jgi:hypothetical protein